MGVGVCLGAGPPGWSRADEVCRVAVDGVGRSVGRARARACALSACCAVFCCQFLFSLSSPPRSRSRSQHDLS